MDDLNEKVNILGVRVSVIDLHEVLARIDAYAGSAKPALINNVNVYACNLAFAIPEFRQILNESEIVFCDGFGVKVAARMLNKKLGSRMTPPDWIDDLFRICAKRNYSLFFVGDHGEVVDLFSRAVKERHPDLRIVGKHHGYFEIGGDEDEHLIQQIRESGADIIITGMGMPRQEIWAADAKNKLNKGVFIATGSMFRWYTRYEHRAPRCITDNGFEWLARLITRPILHFKRYVVGLPLFFFRIMTYRSPDE